MSATRRRTSRHDGQILAPFVQLEEPHAENGHHQTGSCNDNDPDCHRDSSARNFGQDLAAERGVQHSVSQVGQDIEQTADFARVIPCEVPCDDLSSSQWLFNDKARDVNTSTPGLPVRYDERLKGVRVTATIPAYDYHFLAPSCSNIRLLARREYSQTQHTRLHP